MNLHKLNAIDEFWIPSLEGITYESFAPIFLEILIESAKKTSTSPLGAIHPDLRTSENGKAYDSSLNLLAEMFLDSLKQMGKQKRMERDFMFKFFQRQCLTILKEMKKRENYLIEKKKIKTAEAPPRLSNLNKPKGRKSSKL